MGTLQRIKQFIDSKGITIKSLEESVGFSNGAFGSQLRNNKTIGVDKIENILSAYPEISPEWLLTGKGEMLRDHIPEPGNMVPVAHRSPTDGIPLIPIDAMAGFGNGDVGVLELECDRYVVPLFRNAEFLIQVKGSSMYPKYSSGDVVACKKLPLSDLFFQWNKVYVLDTVQGALIKRIKKGTAPSHVLVVSDNPAYDQFELSLDKIYSVAIVIGVIRLE